MPSRKKQVILLIFLVLTLFVINYSYLDNALKKFLSSDEFANVTRIIDGDTIVINGDTHVRLLGINCPEKKEKYFFEAKEFLEKSILGKEVRLEFSKEKYDKYHRLLAYIYLGPENINLKLVKNGLANFYFPSGKDVHYVKFKNAWENCIQKQINLCEKSNNKCSNCIELANFDYKNEIIIFHNNCYFDCDLSGWSIKDEGRKNFFFSKFVLSKNKNIEIKVGEGKDNNNVLFWQGKDYVWTDIGDTMFLRDEKNMLVLWKNY